MLIILCPTKLNFAPMRRCGDGRHFILFKLCPFPWLFRRSVDVPHISWYRRILWTNSERSGVWSRHNGPM